MVDQLDKLFIVLGAIFSFLSVAFGAFGAHILKEKLSEHALSIFQTGVQYQMMHALGLILIGILASKVINGPSQSLHWAGILMALGIVVFSGSLYVLSTTGIGILGAITPIGGVLFLISWFLVILAFLRA
ncbi:DUF423 domain-containing protein [Terrilactibacillus sp. BCM23-1]|uniref:DUF423 domain-containing protein n=1 Tax=Terrilactibacillus tamarindi TaxID=2599694 RepID=A0A6N8CM47_9BACI|nr:DUF423 domain-containing protein [Terrilactibacillus tamarindi]